MGLTEQKMKKKMKVKSFIVILMLMIASMQTMWAQGFRVYKSDGTIAQFSLRTDSIVFYDNLGSDEDFGPFTPVNQCIVGTWYLSKTETVTFNANGTTDYINGATYEFMPYQGSIIIYNASGAPMNILKVYKLTAERMIVRTSFDSDLSVWYSTSPAQLVTSIVLSDTSIILQPDASKRLTATVLPSDADNKNVLWESSNEAVAEVNSSGRVTANANGTCIITCSATDGSGVKAECQVTVGNPVTSITLNKTSVSLSLPNNKTVTLLATILPTNATNKNVTWSSSNTGVATVSNGTVTAVAAGNCTITCSAKDGSGVKAECPVTVTAEQQLVTSITLSQSSLSLEPGKTQTLTATVMPTNATNKSVTWSSNKTSVATVNQTGKVTAVAVGTCTITCSAKDGSGVKAECQVTVGYAHEYVDLGLPSGTLWATCNIGASSPEKYGNYFAWGETEPKDNYDWSTYKWCKGSEKSLTKYCQDISWGYNYFYDNKTTLDPEDDAAAVNWGGNWRMPTAAQVDELISICTKEWTQLNGVYGLLVTGPNSNSIFLPDAGTRNGVSLNGAGSWGSYWTCSIGYGGNSLGSCLYFDNTNCIQTDHFHNRFFGLTVRPVCR